MLGSTLVTDLKLLSFQEMGPCVLDLNRLIQIDYLVLVWIVPLPYIRINRWMTYLRFTRVSWKRDHASKVEYYEQGLLCFERSLDDLLFDIILCFGPVEYAPFSFPEIYWVSILYPANNHLKLLVLCLIFQQILTYADLPLEFGFSWDMVGDYLEDFAVPLFLCQFASWQNLN